MVYFQCLDFNLAVVNLPIELFWFFFELPVFFNQLLPDFINMVLLLLDKSILAFILSNLFENVNFIILLRLYSHNFTLFGSNYLFLQSDLSIFLTDFIFQTLNENFFILYFLAEVSFVFV